MTSDTAADGQLLGRPKVPTAALSSHGPSQQTELHSSTRPHLTACLFYCLRCRPFRRHSCDRHRQAAGHVEAADRLALYFFLSLTVWRLNRSRPVTFRSSEQSRGIQVKTMGGGGRGILLSVVCSYCPLVDLVEPTPSMYFSFHEPLPAPPCQDFAAAPPTLLTFLSSFTYSSRCRQEKRFGEVQFASRSSWLRAAQRLFESWVPYDCFPVCGYQFWWAACYLTRVPLSTCRRRCQCPILRSILPLFIRFTRQCRFIVSLVKLRYYEIRI